MIQTAERLAGVDEAGRGPLAGDVIAAAVVFDKKRIPSEVQDSKKLTAKKRERLYDEIIQSASAWAIGRASVEEIDQLNIFHASLLAMKRAIEGVGSQENIIFYVDGQAVPLMHQVHLQAVVRGDSLLPVVGAASILAKVTRDREMMTLDRLYPQYGFASHKGYPTQQHMDAIKRWGVLEVHRRSFAPVREALSRESDAVT
jgi:ribonuclease HII